MILHFRLLLNWNGALRNFCDAINLTGPFYDFVPKNKSTVDTKFKPLMT